MEIGLELKKDKALYDKIFSIAGEKGLHLVGDTEGLIQIMPPLTIPQEILDEGLEILIKTIKQVIK